MKVKWIEVEKTEYTCPKCKEKLVTEQADWSGPKTDQIIDDDGPLYYETTCYHCDTLIREYFTLSYSHSEYAEEQEENGDQ